MQSNDYTVYDLFNGDKTFVVPRYQRLYVWNEEDQWEPLWDDVKHIADQLFNDAKLRGSELVDQSKAESHFIGTLVLKSHLAQLGSSSKWQVIDGQQRLTTLQLMMSGVADAFVARSVNDRAVRSLLMNNVPDDPLKIEHRKFEHKMNPYAGFREAMDPQFEKEEIAGPMGACYRFFKDEAVEWLDADESISTRANALGTAILFKFRVVAIELDSGEEEHKIFETLNARGAPLTEWDKIKNMLLAKSDQPQDDDSQDKFYEKYLLRFDDDWWRERVGRGAQERPRSDWFADYWVESKTGEQVAIRRVFREFQQYVENRGVNIEVIGDELIEDASYYQKYERSDQSDNSAERQFHDRRRSLGIGALWPMMFELNRVLNRLNPGAEIRDKCFLYLESYLVRRAIVGHNAQGYPQVGFEMIRSLRTDLDTETDVAELLVRRLDRYRRAGNRWPGTRHVPERILNRKMPFYVQRLVLEAIEAEMITQDAGYDEVPEGLEVEHLMPQRWRNGDWPLVNPDGDDERDYTLQTIGNLTLIRSGLNKRLSNRSWEHKQALIKQADNLFMNRELLKDAPDTWDEDQIRKRGEWIGKRYVRSGRVRLPRTTLRLDEGTQLSVSHERPHKFPSPDVKRERGQA